MGYSHDRIQRIWSVPFSHGPHGHMFEASKGYQGWHDQHPDFSFTESEALRTQTCHTQQVLCTDHTLQSSIRLKVELSASGVKNGNLSAQAEATNLKWSHTHILFDLDRDSWKDWLIKSSKQKMQKKPRLWGVPRYPKSFIHFSSRLGRSHTESCESSHSFAMFCHKSLAMFGSLSWNIKYPDKLET